MSWLSRLARDLQAEGAEVALEPLGQGLTIAALHGSWAPPLLVTITEAELERHLRHLATDAVDVFPDVEPLIAAYRLLLVHVQETVATKCLPGSVISIVDGRLSVDPERPPERVPDLPDGDLRWTAARPEAPGDPTG